MWQAARLTVPEGGSTAAVICPLPAAETNGLRFAALVAVV